MFGIRMLGVATAYSIVLLEVYSGAINGPLWWILPGALVLALLLAMSLFGINPNAKEGQRESFAAVAAQWTMILAAAAAMSAFSNYFGREFLRGLPSFTA